MNKLRAYLNEMRVKHYLKNALIFIPIIFSGQLLNNSKLINTILGFFSFSLLASIVYIFNDLKDIDKDKNHVLKKNRPLAAGLISKKETYILIVTLIILFILTNIVIYLLGNIEFNTFIVSILFEIIYLLINIGYSCGLKNIPILDVVILVFGFLIRIFFGAVINDIIISNWLYLTVMSGSFFMGFGKRRNEIIKQQDISRDVLKKYNKNFLDKYMYVCLILSIVFYSLWSIDSKTISRIGNEYMIYTIPLVLIIFMRYSLNIEGDSYGEPVDIIFNDKILIGLILILLLMMVGIIYLF